MSIFIELCSGASGYYLKLLITAGLLRSADSDR